MSAEPNQKPRPQSAAMPDWKKPLGLAIALTVFGGGALWYETQYRPKKEESEQSEKKIFQVKEIGIAQVQLKSAGQTWTFKCLDDAKKLCKPGDQSKWQMEEPSQLKADDSNVNSLLSALKNVQSQESVDISKQTPEKQKTLLGEYGLSEEARKAGTVRQIELTDSEGKTRTFWLGATHPIGDGIFTLASTTGEQTVFVLPSHFKSHFERDLRFWRNKKLMAITTGDITEFSLTGATGKVSGVRKDGQWSVSGSTGKDLAGDPETIDSLLSALSNLSAKEFPAEKKESEEARKVLSGAKKVISLAVGFKPKKEGEAADAPLQLDVFEKTSAKKGESAQLFATLSTNDPLYELDSGAKKRLDQSLSSLRLSKLLTSLERYGTKRIEFRSQGLGEAPLVVVSKEGKWQTEPKTTPEDTFDSDQVQKVLDRLSGSRIIEFLPNAKANGDAAAGIRVTLFLDEAGTKKRELHFWKSKDGKTLFARDVASQRSEVFKVDMAIDQILPKAREFFVKAKPASEPTATTSAPSSKEPKDHGPGDGHGH